jgi:EAL domain-containing protein (putative c-di-GMP-specific phosphodiesterase class I)
MQPELLFVLQVLAYATFPIYFATLRSRMRQVFLYVYAGIVLTVGGFLGSVHAYALVGGVDISAGSVAYGALMMTTLVLVVVEHDVQVVRNVVRLVVVVNVFKVVLYQVTATALRSEEFPNPFDTAPSVFSVSLRVVLAGGFLIVLELLLLLFAFERLKSTIASPHVLRALYVGCFVAILCLDGVLFPVLAVPSPGDWGDLILRGVRAKFVLGVAYSLPVLGFLWAFRATLAAYEATPLRLQEVLFARRDTIIEALVQEREARQASDRQLAEASLLARSMASVDRDRAIEDVLAQLGDVLHPLPGVQPVPLAVVAGRPGEGVIGFGPAPSAPIELDDLVSRMADDPWLERSDLHDVACIPLRTEDDLSAVLAVSVEHERSGAALDALADLSVELGAILAPSLRRACDGWTDRSPILRVLETRGIEPVFQPIVTMADRVACAFEGLSRFEHGLVPDTAFRRAASLGLGVELELLAVDRILEGARSLPPGVPVSVNVSVSTARSAGLGDVLARRDRPVKLEVTEHEPVDDYESLLGAFLRLDDVGIVVDDAGSGYASLQHILRLRPDEVKLDRVWVHGIDRDRPRQVLIGGLRSFVEEVGATLVAEGIEREEEAATLRRIGVEHGQGLLFGGPAPAESFVADVRRR